MDIEYKNPSSTHKNIFTKQKNFSRQSFNQQTNDKQNNSDSNFRIGTPQTNFRLKNFLQAENQPNKIVNDNFFSLKDDVVSRKLIIVP